MDLFHKIASPGIYFEPRAGNRIGQNSMESPQAHNTASRVSPEDATGGEEHCIWPRIARWTPKWDYLNQLRFRKEIQQTAIPGLSVRKSLYLIG
jgi:hypothetical protein